MSTATPAASAARSGGGAPVAPAKPTHRGRNALFALAVIAFTALTMTPQIGGIDIDLASIAKNWRNGAAKLAQMLHPNFAFLPRTVQPMLETLQMAIVGAVLSAIISIPLTLWAAQPTNPNSVGRTTVRTIINIMRSVPDLVYASILVAMVGVGALPGVLTLFLFDLGIVVKLVSEAIDSADHPYIEAGYAAGGTQFQINHTMALPQVMPLFANQWLYTLELNVRVSAILGLVGAGGIGRLLEERRAFFAYDDVSIIILEILVVVVLVEMLSNWLRKKLV